MCTNVFNASTDWDVPNTQGIYTLNSVTGGISAGGVHRRQLLAPGDPVRVLLGAASGSSAALLSAEEVGPPDRLAKLLKSSHYHAPEMARPFPLPTGHLMRDPVACFMPVGSQQLIKGDRTPQCAVFHRVVASQLNAVQQDG